MDYFLDTNIIIILFEGRDSEIKNKVKDILTNNNNSFYASTISILEMAQLYRKKRINNRMPEAACFLALSFAIVLSPFFVLNLKSSFPINRFPYLQ